MEKVIVIGSGVAGLSAAAFLAKAGFDVTVFEKNDSPGGRMRMFESDGFRFDMGPSWYWMPDVFENFFRSFGKEVSDFYELQRLDPSYRIYYDHGELMDVPAGIPALCNLFEKLEKGSSKPLMQFLDEGSVKYSLGIGNLVYKPGLSFREFADRSLIKGIWRLHVFQSMASYVRKFFSNERIIGLLEFPVLFLGAAPEKTPALYSLMNYADMALGTWYPMGGMYRIIEAMAAIARSQGVQFHYNAPVTRIEVDGTAAKGVWSDGTFYAADFIVAGADYRHVEQELLPAPSRRYSVKYWNDRTMAPSCLIFYLGINKLLPNLLHHTLFFDQDMGLHISQIYDDPQWPSAPQFYVCCPSKTDVSVAPAGCENLFILIPVAPGLKDEPETREKYFNMVIERLEKLTGASIRGHIVLKRSYAHNDFTSDYNAFRGNAYGLANTLRQTANFKPGIVNNRVRNLFFTGQLTVPGPGVPPAIISGQVAATTLIKKVRLKNKHIEAGAVSKN